MLQEGDIFELKEGHVVRTLVPKHFIYSDSRGCFDLTNGVVTVGDHFSYLAGRYVVYKTAMEGGGTCHNDVYSNGHHVYAERLDDTGTKVSFYQSGSFPELNKDIKAVGKAVRKWVEGESPYCHERTKKIRHA